MKRFFLLLCAMALLLLCGCGHTAPAGEDALSVVVTIFPEYDWVREILGEDTQAELTLLVSNGTDIHSYQATAQDMVRIASCDVFIYTGGVSDQWVEEALAASPNEERIVIDLMDVMGDGLLADTMLEGMEHDHDHEGHDHSHDAWDEHIWLSLKNAELLCDHIAEELGRADPENARKYLDNAQNYGAKLTALDEAYTRAVENGDYDTLLFADRYPFRYLAADYGLTAYAAFPGCSAEAEASFETIAFLAGKVDELGLSAILTIEGGDGSLARTVSETAAGKPAVLTLNSMQAVSAADGENGASYIAIMEENLEVLKEALSGKE